MSKILSKEIRLGDIASARSGDKGSNSNIGVIAHDPKDYALIEKQLTKERVLQFFSNLGIKRVDRYTLPNLLSLNFILVGALEGGGSRSLRLDAQGKALGQAILEMKIPLVDKKA